MKTPKQNTKPGLISAFKKQIPSSQAQQTKLMKNSYLIRSSAFSVALLAVSFIASNSARAAVVAMIDVGGNVDITDELGTLSKLDMQTLITTTNDLTMAGVLDSEGTWPALGAGTFENEIGVLSGKITGAERYGRTGGAGQYASGSRWGYVLSAGNETWTPDVYHTGFYNNYGLTHFGLITTPVANSDGRLFVTVTYSDATTESLEGVNGQTNWLGFHKDGEIITSINVTSPSAGGVFANYDDVSLVFSVPEPSSTALLGLGGLALVLRRKRS